MDSDEEMCEFCLHSHFIHEVICKFIVSFFMERVSDGRSVVLILHEEYINYYITHKSISNCFVKKSRLFYSKNLLGVFMM